MITQREFFDSMAEKWDIICKHDTDKIKYILNLLNIESGAKILDVGTGTGILIPFLAEQAGKKGEIKAIDISDKMLEIAQRKYKYDNVSFICGDVLESNLQHGYFDFVICYSMFPHFSEKQLAIKIIAKYLKKGGQFAICHSQSREAINNLHKNTSEAVSEDNLPQMHIIKEYFKNSDLETIVEMDNEEMFVIVAKKVKRDGSF
ncbi:class I SAM-dependent methyltransferase [Geosporobacter ferrireducens]|nr:class I SAM-dependent methyltransferase [Geosporobacter ferrireducens]